MSEQGLILLGIVAVAIVALVVVLAIVTLARKEAGKKIHIGDNTINIDRTRGPVNVAQDTKSLVTQRVDVKTSIKLHLALLSFLPPSFTIVGLMIWWLNPYLAVLSNVLIWSAVTLLIPAIYGEVHRFASIVNKSLLILDILFFILLWTTILAPRLMTMEVILGMSVTVMGFAIAAKIHKTSNQG